VNDGAGELFHGLLTPAWVRALGAGLTSMALVLVAGRWFIDSLRRWQVLERSQRGDSERLDLLHAGKSSTPTMGGILVCGSVALSTAAWARLHDRLVLLLLGYLLALGLLGFVDDLTKLRRRKGLSARAKLAVEVLISLALGVYLYFDPPQVSSSASTALFLPFFKHLCLDLGPAYVLLVICVTTGSANAVNLADGLDGLAAGLSLLVAAALLALACICGLEGSGSATSSIAGVKESGEVAVFLGALLGAGLGFLWFNCHPAEIFLGDTGALPLGGSLGLAAVLLKQEAMLLLVGGVLVAETLSVMLQVLSFKLRGKRIFLIAPLHHHFQFKGWPETKVTLRFWLAGALFALCSLLALV